MATGMTSDQRENTGVEPEQLLAAGQVGRRGLLIKGALVSAGLVAATFVPPTITAVRADSPNSNVSKNGQDDDGTDKEDKKDDSD